MVLLLTALRLLISLLFDSFLWPVNDSPRLAIIWCAVVLGLLAGWLMRWLTPRKLLKHLGVQTKAELLAIRLFADQPLGLVTSLGRLSWLVVARIACFLPAVLLLLPIGLLMQPELEQRFAWRPLRSDESMIVELELTLEGWKQSDKIRLQEVNGQSNTRILGPLKDSEERKVYWSVQLGGQRQSSYQKSDVTIELSDESFSIPLAISNDSNRVAPLRNPMVTEFYANSTKPPIENLILRYPAREWNYFSFDVPWWMVFSICFIVTVWIVDRRPHRD